MHTYLKHVAGACAAAFALVSVAYAQPSSREVYYQNWSAGAGYTQSMATTDWSQLHYWDSDINASIKTYDSTNGYKGLRVKMPANTVSSNNGILFDSKLANGSDYTLEYKVLFESGFEFSRGNSGSVYGGGKLPGLGGGNRPGGGAGAAGSQDGMSARFMFRRDPTQSSPYLELYLYWRGQSGTYGDSIVLQTGITTNTWYTLKQRVRLGTTSSDGNVTVWINGAQKLNRNFRFLASGKTWKLNGIMHHAFMGGGDSSWAPTADRYLILDNFKVNSTAF
jgi:hypothetical protein